MEKVCSSLVTDVLPISRPRKRPVVGSCWFITLVNDFKFSGAYELYCTIELPEILLLILGHYKGKYCFISVDVN